MERPPKKYVCEKCGYLGDTSEHEGCDYLAWTTGEQLYIDQLERELALLKASPVGAPEGWKLVPVVPTHAILDVMFNAGIDRHDGDLTLLYSAILAAAPTLSVSEGSWHPIETAPKETTQMFVVVAFGAKVGATPYNSDSWCVWHQRGEFVRWPHKFSPTHWMPLPEATAMQEDKL